MLSIVTVLKEWRVFLYNIIELFKVIIDHRNLVKFLTIKELNQRQVKWIKEFIKYYFKIKRKSNKYFLKKSKNYLRKN